MNAIEKWGERAIGAACFAVLMLLALALLCGCATVRKGLDGAFRTGVAAREVAQGDAFCRPVLERCKAEREYPCPRLDACQDAQIKTMKGIETLQRAVLTGWRAQALGKDADAARALALALETAAQVTAALKTWGVSP